MRAKHQSPHFEWQAGDDDGHWETIAQETGNARRTRRRRVLWYLGIALLAAIVVTAACGYVVVRRRYDEASRQIAFQIQSAIDLEARAFAEGNKDLFLAQQDEASALWYESQSRSLERRGRSFAPVLTVLPAQIDNVTMQGDVAWVQVIEGDPPLRRVRFYRQTDKGWLHTAPDLRFWRTPVEHGYGDQLVFSYHQSDQPYIDPLLDQLAQAFIELCASAGCAGDAKFVILFYPEDAGSDAQVNLALPSPWLSGIPEGDWSELYGEAAVSALARRITAWASAGGTAQARLQGRMIAQDRWLGLPAITPEVTYLTPLMGRGGVFRSQDTQ